MPTPPSLFRHRTFVLGILVVVALFVVVMVAQWGGLSGLRGALTDKSFLRNGITEYFRFGTLASAEPADLPAGTHGVFTCPTTLGSNEVWLGPSAFSGVPGLKIYEYTQTFAQEKDPVNPVWPGEQHGFSPTSARPPLVTFKAGRTYYVQSAQQFTFRCSGPAPASSSSSSSSSIECTGTLCNNSQVCVNGTCLPCSVTNVCPPLMICNSGICITDILSSSSSSSNSSSSSISSITPIQADISITALGIPSSIAPGGTITMSYQMSNAGPGSPVSVLLSFIPSGVFTLTNPNGCTQQGNSYQCGPFAGLSSGGSVGKQISLTVSSSAPCGSLQSILGSVSLASGTDPVPDNNTVNSTVSIACSSSSSSSSSSSTPPLSSSSSSSSTPPSSSSSSVPEAGLIGYWPLNEGTGTVSQDATTGDHDVVFTNNAAWGAPLTGAGSAASLNGADQYVNIGALSVFNFENNRDFSLAAWVRPSATNPQDGIIVGKVENSSFAFPGWAMTYTADQRFGFKMSGRSFLTPIGLDVKTNATFAPNTTHHVVVSYNGTNAAVAGKSDAVKIYVDGTEYSVARGNLTISLDNLRNTGGISTISNNGEAQIGMGDGSISPFAGLIDDVKIYDRVIVPAI